MAFRDNLVGEWLFTEGSVADTSGNGNPATNNGADLTTDRFGSNDDAYDFNGTSDTITFPADLLAGATSITIGFWYYSDNNTEAVLKGIIAEDDLSTTANNAWSIFYDNRGGANKTKAIRFGIGDGTNGTVLSVDNFFNEPTGIWHHVVAVWDNTNLYIYKDGSLSSSGSDGGVTAINNNSATPYIGRTAFSGDGFWDGKLDDVRIWTRALSASEIALLYDIGATGKSLQDGLVLDLNMDTLEDYSGNSNNGTATGTTKTTDHYNRYNQARSFNGSSDYITVLDSLSISAFDDFSFSLWIKTTNSSGSLFVQRTGFQNNESYTTYLTSGYPKILLSTSGSSTWSGLTATQTVNDGNWHNVIFTRVGSTVSIYIDGKLDNTGTYSGTLYDSTENLKIGNGNGFFNGDMSEPKMWDRGLSADEVQQLYLDVRGNMQGLFEDCVAYYDFKGDAKDIISGTEASVTGATLTTDKFNIFSAYDFEQSSSNYLLNSSINNLTSTVGTVSIWLKKESQSNRQVGWNICDDTNTYNIYFELEADNSVRLYIDTSTGIDDLQFSETISDTEWHHVVFVHDGSGIDLYIDGTFVERETTTRWWDEFTITRLYIGAYSSSATSTMMDGKLTNFMIFEREFTANEVKQLYDLTSKRYIYPYG